MTMKRDPGYGATCRMLAESALCLVKQRSEVAKHAVRLPRRRPSRAVGLRRPTRSRACGAGPRAGPQGRRGGVLTASTCMGPLLVDRLQENADAKFEVVQD